MRDFFRSLGYNMIMIKKRNKAHVVAVDMGYGHLRAAYNLKEIAHERIWSVNTYRGIPKKDRQIWEQSRKFYEFVSKFKNVPVVGEKAFQYF